jgi:hypothetical protein
MGALETRAAHRMILVRHLEKVGKFPQAVLDEVRKGNHQEGIDACLDAMAEVAKQETWGDK